MIRSPVVILALLTGLNLVNYLDRLVVAAVLPKIQEELGLSNFEGGLLATIFLVSYFVASPIFGSLADSSKRTPLLALGVGLWSIATVASGLAPGKLSLFAARALVGVGEASYATIAPTLIDDIAPPQRKGRWLSIFFAAMPIGSALGYILGGKVAHDHGWRAAFFVAGGPGILLALSCLLIVEPPRIVTKAREAVLKVAAELLPIFLFRRSVLGYCAQTAAIGAFSFWAPKFLYAAHGLPLDRANFIFGAITVVAGALGTGIGGVLGDRALRRDWGEPDPDRAAARAFLRVSAWGSIVATPFAVLCFVADRPLHFFVGVFFCELALFVSTSPINAAILRSVPEHRRASAMALTILLIHLLGDLWSPPALGKLADVLGMRPAMISILPLAIALSGAFWWLTRPRAAAAPKTDVPDRSS
jgi:MFS family permease